MSGALRSAARNASGLKNWSVHCVLVKKYGGGGFCVLAQRPSSYALRIALFAMKFKLFLFYLQ